MDHDPGGPGTTRMSMSYPYWQCKKAPYYPKPKKFRCAVCRQCFVSLVETSVHISGIHKKQNPTAHVESLQESSAQSSKQIPAVPTKQDKQIPAVPTKQDPQTKCSSTVVAVFPKLMEKNICSSSVPMIPLHDHDQDNVNADADDDDDEEEEEADDHDENNHHNKDLSSYIWKRTVKNVKTSHKQRKQRSTEDTHEDHNKELCYVWKKATNVTSFHQCAWSVPNQHLVLHFSELNNLKFICNRCKDDFGSFRDLFVHYNELHWGVKLKKLVYPLHLCFGSVLKIDDYPSEDKIYPSQSLDATTSDSTEKDRIFKFISTPTKTASIKNKQKIARGKPKIVCGFCFVRCASHNYICQHIFKCHPKASIHIGFPLLDLLKGLGICKICGISDVRKYLQRIHRNIPQDKIIPCSHRNIKGKKRKNIHPELSLIRELKHSAHDASYATPSSMRGGDLGNDRFCRQTKQRHTFHDTDPVPDSSSPLLANSDTDPVAKDELFSDDEDCQMDNVLIKKYVDSVVDQMLSGDDENQLVRSEFDHLTDHMRPDTTVSTDIVVDLTMESVDGHCEEDILCGMDSSDNSSGAPGSSIVIEYSGMDLNLVCDDGDDDDDDDNDDKSLDEQVTSTEGAGGNCVVSPKDSPSRDRPGSRGKICSGRHSHRESDDILHATVNDSQVITISDVEESDIGHTTSGYNDDSVYMEDMYKNSPLILSHIPCIQNDTQYNVGFIRHSTDHQSIQSVSQGQRASSSSLQINNVIVIKPNRDLE